jgi:hypothetical protein
VSAGEWIALATLVVMVFGAMTGVVWAMLRSQISEARRVASETATAVADLRLELERHYVREVDVEKAVAAGVRPLFETLAFHGRLLLAMAQRGGIDTARVALEQTEN